MKFLSKKEREQLALQRLSERRASEAAAKNGSAPTNGHHTSNNGRDRDRDRRLVYTYICIFAPSYRDMYITHVPICIYPYMNPYLLVSMHAV